MTVLQAVATYVPPVGRPLSEVAGELHRAHGGAVRRPGHRAAQGEIAHRVRLRGGQAAGGEQQAPYYAP